MTDRSETISSAEPTHNQLMRIDTVNQWLVRNSVFIAGVPAREDRWKMTRAEATELLQVLDAAQMAVRAQGNASF